jgi:heme A synthase
LIKLIPALQLNLSSILHAPPGERARNAAGFVRYAWAVLAYNVAVSLWGAFVRASGSGAGCGNHWPLCNGEFVPHSPTLNTIIELTHRSTSGIDLAMVALLVVWAFRAFPKGDPMRLGAVLSGLFLMSEALIGASLVLLEHVAGNTSPYRAYSLSSHLVNTLTLLACLTLTAWWGSGNPRFRLRTRDIATLSGVMLLGISGAIAGLGDTLFPARSLAEGIVQDFSAGANLFVRLRWLHPVIAAAVTAAVLWYATTVGVRRSRWVLGLMLAQLFAGAINLLLMAPLWMQIFHLALAYSFWIALVLLVAQACSLPCPDSSGHSSSHP